MNVIVYSRRTGRPRHLDFAQPATAGLLAAAVVAVLGGAFVLGLTFGGRSDALTAASTNEWDQVLKQQQAQIADLKVQLQERVDALAVRMGQVNAHGIRLDALGKRLTQMANIDSREFNFDSAPASGGPETGGAGPQIPDLSQMILELEGRVQLRDAQLAALENVILARHLNAQILPEGRPVRQGFISSYFGERQDPFTGHQAFHKGVDFASSRGSDVVAVAAGIVTWSGDRSGYGNMVEVSHGNGYVTRYGHNDENIAQVGDTVTRGQPIARMGSTGRSTGPHVHFEVLKAGRQVDPLTFIGR